jgi:hypothetical protein
LLGLRQWCSRERLPSRRSRGRILAAAAGLAIALVVATRGWRHRFPGEARGLVLVVGALALSQEAKQATALLSQFWLLDCAWLRDALVAASATNPLATQYLLSTKSRADRRILQRPMTLADSTRDLGVWLKQLVSTLPDGSAVSADRRRLAGIAVPTASMWGAGIRRRRSSRGAICMGW